MKRILTTVKNFFAGIGNSFFPKYVETKQESLVKDLIMEIIKNPTTKVILTNNINSCIFEGYLNNKDENINIVISYPYIYIHHNDEFIELYCRNEFAYRISEMMSNHIHNTVIDVKATMETSKEKILKEIKKTIK